MFLTGLTLGGAVVGHHNAVQSSDPGAASMVQMSPSL